MHFKRHHKKIGQEGRIVKTRLAKFDIKKSWAWETLREKFGVFVHRELVSIATIILAHLRSELPDNSELPKLDRSAKRSFGVMIKWFEENRAVIEPMLSRISLLGTDDMGVATSNVSEESDTEQPIEFVKATAAEKECFEDAFCWDYGSPDGLFQKGSEDFLG
jgi:hypothetical protein